MTSSRYPLRSVWSLDIPSSSIKVKLPFERGPGDGYKNAVRESSPSATEFLQMPPKTIIPPSRMNAGVRLRGESEKEVGDYRFKSSAGNFTYRDPLALPFYDLPYTGIELAPVIDAFHAWIAFWIVQASR